MKDLRTAELRDEIRLRKALNTVQSASRYTSTFNETTADKLSVWDCHCGYESPSSQLNH
jgi:hypothetical protein